MDLCQTLTPRRKPETLMPIDKPKREPKSQNRAKFKRGRNYRGRNFRSAPRNERVSDDTNEAPRRGIYMRPKVTKERRRLFTFSPKIGRLEN